MGILEHGSRTKMVEKVFFQSGYIYVTRRTYPHVFHSHRPVLARSVDTRTMRSIGWAARIGRRWAKLLFSILFAPLC